MSRKTLTVDIDDVQVYEELKRRAARDRRTLKAYVNLVLERHCGMSLAPQEVTPDRSSSQEVPTTVSALRELVNRVKPGAVKTGRELLEQAREREGRRGDEGGSQIRDDEDF